MQAPSRMNWFPEGPLEASAATGGMAAQMTRPRAATLRDSRFAWGSVVCWPGS